MTLHNKIILTNISSRNQPKIVNDYGTFIEMNDPKIFGAIVAVLVGYFSKNVIATIFSGLLSYWFVIFIF